MGVREGDAFTLEARAEVQAVAHTLRGNGFDASEDGTGRGTPLVAVHAPVISPALKARDHKGPSSDGDGDGAPLIAVTEVHTDELGLDVQDGDPWFVLSDEASAAIRAASRTLEGAEG
jgi:DNA (cytosine-5)-methyltransferase 1